MTKISNRLLDQIKVGDTASTERVLQVRDVRAWAAAFGEIGPCDADSDRQGAVAILSAILTALVGSTLPGAGSTVHAVTVSLAEGARVNLIDTRLTVTLTVRDIQAATGRLTLTGQVADLAGQPVITAVLEVAAPLKSEQREMVEHRLDGLLQRCAALKPMLTGIVHPCSAEALAGAVEAAQAELITPVLFGPKAELQRLAKAASLSLDGYRLVDTSGPEESAMKAAMEAGSGAVQALMKGSLHTDVLLHAILQKEANLRTGRLISHCLMVSAPTYARRFVISDVALNIAPDTDQKRDICQNAIGFARALGIETPKVAILAAVETVRTKMPATLDGAILAKMADRGQIVGGVVDGPLDLDAAVDAEAARIKQIRSPVAGVADVLIVPNIEAGNMIYKNLAFMADAQTAGLVVGARVPVILTSRADTGDVRRFSAAAAVLYADALAKDPSMLTPEIAE
jgi:phosphate acetyltransferase/phosphate butyryltransferase